MSIRATAALIAFAAFAVGTSAAMAQPAEPAANDVATPTAASPSAAAPSEETVASTNAESQPADAPSQERTTDDGPSPDAARVINWILESHDNGELPFMVIDKIGAEVFAFDAVGQSFGHAPVLVGITKGDDSSPGVGDRELSHIPVSQRTTPAGRFLAKFGLASGHQQVLWVDYRDAISLHPVITTNPKEHRLARLKSPTPDDNRITFGCINVPKAYYNNVVRPLFKQTGGIVYILPETKPLNEVFFAPQFAGQPGNASEISR